jgi:hypothetical protein
MGRRYEVSDGEPSPAAAALPERDGIRAVALRRAGRPGAAAEQQYAVSGAAPWPVAAALAVDERQVRRDAPSPAALQDAPSPAVLLDEAPQPAARPALADRLFHAPGRTNPCLQQAWKHQPKPLHNEHRAET